MPNPIEAKYPTICGDCGEKIEPGDDIFFIDNSKTCELCAENSGNVCDCGQFKKEEFNQCFDCSQS